MATILGPNLVQPGVGGFTNGGLPVGVSGDPTISVVPAQLSAVLVILFAAL